MDFNFMSHIKWTHIIWSVWIWSHTIWNQIIWTRSDPILFTRDLSWPEPFRTLSELTQFHFYLGRFQSRFDPLNGFRFRPQIEIIPNCDYPIKIKFNLPSFSGDFISLTSTTAKRDSKSLIAFLYFIFDRFVFETHFCAKIILLLQI